MKQLENGVGFKNERSFCVDIFYIRKKQFWCRTHPKRVRTEPSPSFIGDDFEDYDSGLEVGIQMRNLVKVSKTFSHETINTHTHTHIYIYIYIYI